jgi:hypothetical protein
MRLETTLKNKIYKKEYNNKTIWQDLQTEMDH